MADGEWDGVAFEQRVWGRGEIHCILLVQSLTEIVMELIICSLLGR